MQQIITVEKMSCQNCLKHVTKHFQALDGVSKVDINLDDKTATVTTEVAHSLADYQSALTKTIYQATEMR